jgi:precorrin-6B methylase 2
VTSAIVLAWVFLGALIAALGYLLVNLFNSLLPLLYGGAIYVPTKRDRVERMVTLAGVRPGEKAVDLGSGDGRLVIALARAGAEAHGYEVNPLLVRRSRKSIRAAGLEDRVFICQGSFWDADLAAFDVIAVYGMQHVMGRLERKLEREMKDGARLVANSFDLPTWEPLEKSGGVYLYRKGAVPRQA